MTGEELKFVESIVEALRNVVKKERELNNILDGETVVYKEIIEDLQLAICDKLGLDYACDGSDDGNYKEGLVSFVINGDISIPNLLEYKKRENEIWNRYSVLKEIDVDTRFEEERKLKLGFNIGG